MTFISTVRPAVHANPSKKGAFRKRSSNRRNLKTPALRLSVDGKRFENEAFWQPRSQGLSGREDEGPWERSWLFGNDNITILK